EGSADVGDLGSAFGGHQALAHARNLAATFADASGVVAQSGDARPREGRFDSLHETHIHIAAAGRVGMKDQHAWVKRSIGEGGQPSFKLGSLPTLGGAAHEED